MRRTPLKRTSAFLPRGSKPLTRTSAPPRRSKGISPASPEQRAKANAPGFCTLCGKVLPLYAMHIVDRSLGGCDHPDCIVPACLSCHRAYDAHELDALPKLEPRFRREIAHAVEHLGLLATVERLTGERYRPVGNGVIYEEGN